MISDWTVESEDQTPTARPNSDSDTVTELRASDGKRLRDVSVGSRPWGIAFDGTNIWVTNFYSNTVTKFRARDGGAPRHLRCGRRPSRYNFRRVENMGR